MSDPFKFADLGAMDCWPLCGFAPGGYLHKRCSGCNQEFTGEKRATCCLSCAIKLAKNNVSNYERDLRGMGEELRKADVAAANPKEWIAAVALYHGSVISLPRPARHGHVFATMHSIMGIDATKVPPENQGFITSTGRFVNRVEAKLIAYQAGQIIRHSAGDHCPELYSEDLW